MQLTFSSRCFKNIFKVANISQTEIQESGEVSVQSERDGRCVCVCVNVCMIPSTNGSLFPVKKRNVSVCVRIKNSVRFR